MEHNAILRGDGLTLLPLTAADVTDRYVAWLNDPTVTAGTEVRFSRHSQETVRDYVTQAVASPYDKMWRIMIEEIGHVGNVRLSAINAMHRRARVSLIIGEKSVWGRGVGSAAIGLVARHAFDDIRLHKLGAGIYATNLGSRRAFEKAGFFLEATLRDEAYVDVGFVNVWLMARFVWM